MRDARVLRQSLSGVNAVYHFAAAVGVGQSMYEPEKYIGTNTATPVMSDDWEGIDTFFTLGEEILISRTAADTLTHLQVLGETKRRAIGARARARMLAEHTPAHRAEALEGYVFEAFQRRIRRSQSHPDAPRHAV